MTNIEELNHIISWKLPEVSTETKAIRLLGAIVQEQEERIKQLESRIESLDDKLYRCGVFNN